MNKIFNEDCITTMNNMEEKSIDLIITSPPYNSNVVFSLKEKNGLNYRKKLYDKYNDNKTELEYINWTVDIFNLYDKILKNDRIVLYNFSYSVKTAHLPYLLMSEIIKNTNFTIAETIIWKKSNAIPCGISKNRLMRLTEFVFVLCRKDELKTFKMNKKIGNGNKMITYEVISNFIESKNNDKSCELNKATFSTDLINKLIKMYGFEGDIIYDSFIGTGTTAISALMNNCYYVGSEISEEQCEYAKNRINEYIKK